MYKRKSECDKIREELSAYVDDELSPGDRGVVESHIEGCAACQQELESLRATVDLLNRAPVVEPPRSYALDEATRPVSPDYAWVFGVLRVATAVAVVLLALVFVADFVHPFAAVDDGGPVDDEGVALCWSASDDGLKVLRVSVFSLDTKYDVPPQEDFENAVATANWVLELRFEHIGVESYAWYMGDTAGGRLGMDKGFDADQGYTAVQIAELSLLGVVLGLGVATAIVWLRRRRCIGTAGEADRD
jgi:hypothetical protein